jgi:hypothetical protein
MTTSRAYQAGRATALMKLGMAGWLARDKADTEQYMASPEYQAMLKAHAAKQKAPKPRFDFDTWADGTQRQLDAEATAAGSPR